MFSKRCKWILVCSVVLLFAGPMCRSTQAADREVVGFRLANWMTAHFDDAALATANFKALRDIGCEAQQHQHGDHVDVRYRCVQWRSIALDSHAEAHQWESWLKANGFETSHKH